MHAHTPRRPEDSSAKTYVNFDLARAAAMHIPKPNASMGGHCAAIVEPNQWPDD
jgi:hypothetical protein